MFSPKKSTLQAPRLSLLFSLASSLLFLTASASDSGTRRISRPRATSCSGRVCGARKKREERIELARILFFSARGAEHRRKRFDFLKGFRVEFGPRASPIGKRQHVPGTTCEVKRRSERGRGLKRGGESGSLPLSKRSQRCFFFSFFDLARLCRIFFLHFFLRSLSLRSLVRERGSGPLFPKLPDRCFNPIGACSPSARHPTKRGPVEERRRKRWKDPAKEA